MQATVTKAFSGVPDGEIYPRTFDVGETVTGELAAVAVREGWASDDSKPAIVSAPRKGRKKGDSE